MNNPVDGAASGFPRRLETPRAAAVAGVVFSCLFSASVLLMRSALPDDPSMDPDWIVDGEGRIRAATALMPFAGISFLWFVGVVRDRLGALEDQFFSSVFYGSALLFLAMAFASTAVAAGMAAGAGAFGGVEDDYVPVAIFGRSVILHLGSGFGVRMAAVLMVSVATIWWRTELMPRWLVMLTYLLAVPLLTLFSLSVWFALVFPAWTFLVSVYLIVRGPADLTDA